MPLSRSMAYSFDELCDKTPHACISSINAAQRQLAFGGEEWWALESTRLTWLFEFQQQDALYAALRPWINNNDVPTTYQPLVTKLVGKWLLMRGRTEEADKTFQQALKAFFASYDAAPTRDTALHILNLLVSLNRLEQAESFVNDLVDQDFDDAAFYREVYAELGHIAYRTNDNAKHVEYRLASLEWAKRLDDKQQISVAYNNYGVALRNAGQLINAQNAFISSLSLAESASDNVRINSLYVRLAEVALMLNDFSGVQQWLAKTDVQQLAAGEFKRLRDLNERVKAAKATQPETA